MNPILEEVRPETAELLATQAKARGLSVDEYLRSLLPDTNGQSDERPFYETATPEEWVKAFREWVASHEARNYGFVDDSRESIYTREDEAL